MSDGGYTCRICFEESEDFSHLISPCQCKGTVTCSVARTEMTVHRFPACYGVSTFCMIVMHWVCATSCTTVNSGNYKVLGLQQNN